MDGSLEGCLGIRGVLDYATSQYDSGNDDTFGITAVSLDNIIASQYCGCMITSFHNAATEQIWKGNFTKKLPGQIQPIARRKLRMLNSARTIDDLRIPPANRLEKLAGDRGGQWSIRINDQWRICFLWDGTNAGRVEICDYH